MDEAVSECLAGTTFVFTGNLETLSRDDGADLVKCLGGRVTTSVSSKTSYLVVGEVLEDGRPYHEGTKYKRASTLDNVKIVMGEKKLFGLAKLYNDRARAKQPVPPAVDKENNQDPMSSVASAPSANPHAKKATPVNPYAKKTVVNPYAKKTVSNPYAKKTTINNPYAKKPSNNSQVNNNDAAAANVDDVANKFGPNALWVDKYAPSTTRNILGNKDSVNKLTSWLATWERKFNNDKAIGKAFSNPSGPWKAALLSGPPGIGSKRVFWSVWLFVVFLPKKKLFTHLLQ